MVVAGCDGFALGLSICYDLRFPELYRALALAGAGILVVPAAFTETTGRAHWEVLLRARAIENGAFVIAAAQHGHEAVWPMFGHSMIVDPWGEVLACLPAGDGVVAADIEMGDVARRRRQLPALRNRRPEVYESTVLHAGSLAFWREM
jgi:nitrilase